MSDFRLYTFRSRKDAEWPSIAVKAARLSAMRPEAARAIEDLLNELIAAGPNEAGDPELLDAILSLTKSA